MDFKLFVNDVLALLKHHQTGDWGQFNDTDCESNRQAMEPLKKEALGRLQDIACHIGAMESESGIASLHQQYQTGGCLASLVKQLAEKAFGLRQVQFIHLEWDQDEVDYRGKCQVFFKAVIPHFNQGNAVYLVFEGSYNDDYGEDNYIYPKVIYTPSEWELKRQQVLSLLQQDAYLARHLTLPANIIH